MVSVRMGKQDEIALHIVRRNARDRVSRQKGIDKHLVCSVIKQKSRMTVVAEFYHGDHSLNSTAGYYCLLYDMSEQCQ